MKPFDANGALKFAHAGGGELRRLAVRGSAVTVLSQGLSLGAQIVSTVVLARLLTPSDFGIVTMVTTFSLLFVSFGLNGFTEAILQRDQIDEQIASNLFWINVGIGLLLTAGFAAAGSILARFYGEPRVVLVAAAISVTILLSSSSVVHLALLKRAMAFPSVAANDVIARILMIVVSISLALAGWRYWALVVGAVSQTLTLTIGSWFRCRWVPRMPRRSKNTGEVVRFALHTYSRFSLGYFAGNIDNLLVGWRFGPGALGFYKKAFDLFALPAGQTVAPITAVAVAALSRSQSDKVQFKRYIVTALSVLAFVGMALAGDLTLVGTDLVRLVLGPAWAEAGRLFTYFGPGIGIMLIYYTHGWIHVSIGRPDRWFRWGLVEVTVITSLFLVALPWGPEGVAVAWTAAFWILTLPAFWYAGVPIQLGITSIIGGVWKYIIASLITTVTLAGLFRVTHPLATVPGAAGAFARIATTSLAFLGLYLSIVVLLHGGYEPFRQLAKFLPDGLLRRSSPKSQPESEMATLSSQASQNNSMFVSARPASWSGELG